MNLTMNEDEIILALKDYIKNQGISIKNKQVSIHLTHKRKGLGVVADIQIDPITESSPAIKADVPFETDEEDEDIFNIDHLKGIG